MGVTYNRAGGLDGIQRLTEATSVEYHLLASSTRSTDTAAARGGQAGSVVLRHSSRDVDWGSRGIRFRRILRWTQVI